MNKEQNGMVRKASELTSLDELNLSKSTRTYIEKNFSSLDEIVLKGRVISYEGARTNWGKELCGALNEAGFIRHDLDEVTMRIAECISYIYDFNLKSLDVDLTLRSYSPMQGNEEYEHFRAFSDEQKCYIANYLEKRFESNPKKARVLKLRWGLEDGCLKTIKETAIILGSDYSYVRELGIEAGRNLRYDCRKKYTISPLNLLNSCSRIEELIKNAEELQEEISILKWKEMELYSITNNLQSYADTPLDGSEDARRFLNPPETPPVVLLEEKFGPNICHPLERRAGCSTIDDLLELGDEIVNVRGIGSKYLKEIIEKMHELGYTDYNPKKK